MYQLIKNFPYVQGTGVPGKSKPSRDHDAIDAACRYFGLFCNVTTMECTAEEALRAYRIRDLIEKTFKGGKSGAGMDVVRAHSDDVMEGRFIVGFVAMTILNEIYRQMKKSTQVVKKDGETEIVRPLCRRSRSLARDWSRENGHVVTVNRAIFGRI